MIDTPKLASITIDIVMLGPRVRIAGVLSTVNGLGGASISITSLSNDFRIRGVLTKYFFSAASLIGIFTAKDVINDKVLSVLRLRTAMKSPM